ncbi:MAG: GYF domain-containing protein [Dysgonamonadaceae bacterium]|jgi:hypothetical protein|nr:GYF domain-containing protein [Dysgonamonadaceae bacterium]
MNRYFYIDTEGRQKGAFTPEELRQENVRRETLVWAQDMSQWTRAEEIGELKFLFSGMPQQPPIQKQPEIETPPPPMPKTWLTESILATILPFIFCWNVFSLLGIIGIIYGSQVESLYRRGEYDAAAASSRTAGTWTKVALWIVFAWIILIIIAIALLILTLGFSIASLPALIDWANSL